MAICRGSNRIVWTLPSQGIAIKFPRIRVRSLLWSLRFARDPGWFVRELFRYSCEDQGSIKWSLFKGFVDNWSEYRYYRSSRHRVLLPTHLSLFGLINVQEIGSSTDIDDELMTLIVHLAGLGGKCDHHHFGNPMNFCVCEGKLRVLDYGSARTQDVLRNVADQLAEAA